MAITKRNRLTDSSNANGLVRQIQNPVRGIGRSTSDAVVVGARAIQDVDLKSTPIGRIGGGSLLTFKLRLGWSSQSPNPDDPYIDILARGLSQRGDVAGRSGIMTPSNLKYWRDQHFFEQNPGQLKQIQAQASDEMVFATAQLAIVRRTPFGEKIDERYVLNSFVDPSALQKTNVIIPADAEIDGTTFLRVYHQLFGTEGLPDDQFLTLTFSFAKLAERRAAVLGG